jgi:hypothetical protein
MYSRLVVPLLCAAAIVFACGPRPRGTTVPTPAQLSARAHSGFAGHHRRGDTTAVDASLDVEQGADGVRLALQVVNVRPKQLEIEFPDGKTREFVILDAAGKEVWRWSKGRLFTQTVQNKFLAAGDTAVYEERWDSAQPGEYTAVASLRSGNYPVERRVSFTIRPTSSIAAVAAANAER